MSAAERGMLLEGCLLPGRCLLPNGVCCREGVSAAGRGCLLLGGGVCCQGGVCTQMYTAFEVIR